MNDVARLAGVAQSTVSLVVNGDERVATETRNNVLKAIEQLGFRANRAARELRRVRSQTIALVTNMMSVSTFPSRLVLGAQEAAWQNDYIILVVDAGEGPEPSERAIKVLVEQDVGGIVYAPMASSWKTVPKALRRIPTVLLNNNVVDVEEFARIDSGDIEGGQLAARSLTEAGHRRILFINGAAGDPAALQREEGFRRVLREFPIGTFELRILYAGYEIRAGYAAVKSLLDAGQWLPTAIFSSSDKSALGAIQALAEQGLKVPEDVSIIGYEDQTQISALSQPPLTSVTIPYHEMGKMAVEILLENPERQPDSFVRNAKPQLVLRESVRRIL